MSRAVSLRVQHVGGCARELPRKLGRCRIITAGGSPPKSPRLLIAGRIVVGAKKAAAQIDGLAVHALILIYCSRGVNTGEFWPSGGQDDFDACQVGDIRNWLTLLVDDQPGRGQLGDRVGHFDGEIAIIAGELRLGPGQALTEDLA